MWRTLPNLQSSQTGHLLARTPSDIVNPQFFPCGAPHALYWEWSSQTKLPPTTSRHQKWWGMMGNQSYTQSLMTQLRIPILHLMKRMADHQCNIGTFHMFWKWWWRNTPRILMLTMPINKPAIMPNKEILTITFMFPEEDLVDPHILAQTTPYICLTPPLPPTSFQCIAQKASTSGKTLLALTWLSCLSCLKWYFRQLKDNLRQLRHLSQVKARNVFPDVWHLELFHQKKFSLLHYLGDHLSNFLTSHLNWYSPCQKLLLKVHPSSILGNKFNVLPHTLTWSTKCYMTLQNQEGTDTFLTLNCGMTPSSNSNGILLSILIIWRTHIKVKTNNLKTPTNSEHEWSTATKEHPPLSHILKLFLNTLKTPKTPSLSLPTAENMPVFIRPFAKKITNMDFPKMTTTTVPSMTKLDKWQPDSSLL